MQLLLIKKPLSANNVCLPRSLLAAASDAAMMMVMTMR
jgi:hypothetical protein